MTPLQIVLTFERGQFRVRGLDGFDERARTLGKLYYVLREQAKALRAQSRAVV